MKFGNVFFGKKVIVTGNTGFKGSWLTVWLLELGAHVVGISKDVPTNPSMFDSLELRSRIKYCECDLRNLSAIKEIFEKEQPDFVFHLAAQPIVSESYLNPIETISSNVIGTASVLEALRCVTNPCNAVIITSDKCYDNVEWTWGYRENDRLGGKDPYSASKGAAELIIKTYFHSYFSQAKSPVKLVSARAGNVIGGGDWAKDRVVPDSVKAWSNGLPVEIRNPKATRPWQHVLEPLSGYLRCAQLLSSTDQELNGDSFNFGPAANQSFTVNELLLKLAKYWSVCELPEAIRYHNQSSFYEAGLLKLNCDKALHQLHWQPVLTFDLTSKYTSLWYNEFYQRKSKSNMYEFTLKQIKQYCKAASKNNLSWIL